MKQFLFVTTNDDLKPQIQKTFFSQQRSFAATGFNIYNPFRNIFRSK